MNSVLEPENKKQCITKARVTTANYFKTHNKFKADSVSLMEISFTHHYITQTLSEDNINAAHNLLTQHICKNAIPTTKQDTLSSPYFKTAKLEYWVSRKTALQLIKALFDAETCYKNRSKQFPQEIVMLPHIRQHNKIKRIDEITQLLFQVCANNPIKIDIARITKPIQSITLGWILAICQMDYRSYSAVDFENPSLDSLAHRVIKKLNIILTTSRTNLDVPIYYTEYDLPTLTSKSNVFSYKITPELIPLIANHDEFNGLFINREPIAIKLTKNNEIEKEVKKHLSERGRKAATQSKKYKNNKILKDEAIKLYKSEKYKSKRQAAINISEKLRMFAKHNALAPLSKEREEKTIYDWILEHTRIPR